MQACSQGALRAAAQPGAPGRLRRRRPAAQLVTQAVRGGQDQRFEAVDGGGAAGDGALAGDQQDPQALAVTVLAGDGLMLTGEGFTCGADGVDGVGLAAVAGRSARVVDLDHHLAVGVQESGESDAVAAGALHRPDQPPAGACCRAKSSSAWQPPLVVATVVVATTAPVGRSSAAMWVSWWVSTPMTAFSCSVTIRPAFLLEGQVGVGLG
jgi:hypothetical protein